MTRPNVKLRAIRWRCANSSPGSTSTRRLVVYLRAVRAVLALEADPEGSQPHLQPETLRDARQAARPILRDIDALIPRAFSAEGHDDPLQLRGVGTIDGVEFDRLANALIRDHGHRVRRVGQYLS